MRHPDYEDSPIKKLMDEPKIWPMEPKIPPMPKITLMDESKVPLMPEITKKKIVQVNI